MIEKSVIIFIIALHPITKNVGVFRKFLFVQINNNNILPIKPIEENISKNTFINKSKIIFLFSNIVYWNTKIKTKPFYRRNSSLYYISCEYDHSKEKAYI